MKGRIILMALILWPIAEIASLVLVADQIGWGWALLGLVGLSVLGVVVIKGTIRAARTIGRTDAATPSASMVGTQAADAGFRLLAGVLLVIPGYLTGCLGLLLLIPPIRALARAGAGNAMLRRYPTMRATITKVRIVSGPGDIVPGQVVSDDPERPGGGQPPTGGQPPALPPGR